MRYAGGWAAHRQLHSAIIPTPCQQGIDPPDSPRIRSLWEERHKGKFVEWEMAVLEVEEEGVLSLAGCVHGMLRSWSTSS